MTTYDRTTQGQDREVRLELLRNRQQWREAEEEWLRAEAALREFEAPVVREPNEVLADLPATRDSLVSARDEALRRVIELDQAYIAALGTRAQEGVEKAFS